MEKDTSDSDSREDAVVDKDNKEDENEIPDKELKCSVCLKVFLHASSLSRHIALKCGSVKKFSCNGCTKSFDRHDSLTRHMGSCKGKDRVWKCGKCNRDFPFNAYLKRHQRTCQNKCPTCRKPMESDDSHICKILSMKLPKNRGSKRKGEETATSEESQLQNLLSELVVEHDEVPSTMLDNASSAMLLQYAAEFAIHSDRLPAPSMVHIGESASGSGTSVASIRKVRQIQIQIQTFIIIS